MPSMGLRRGHAAIEPIWREAPLKLDVTPVERLTEAVRREFFAATVECEDGANRDAERRTDDLDKQIALSRQLGDACKDQLRSRYKVTEAEAERIGQEGATSSWPPRTPMRVNIQPIIQAGLQLCKE